MCSILGQGVGGFVGGQLVSNAGFSLPLLFQVTAGFCMAWTFIFYLIYKVFCSKYESQLIQAKVAEENNAKINSHSDARNVLTAAPSDMEIRQRQNASERSLKTQSIVKLEDSMKYWNTQVIGRTRL